MHGYTILLSIVSFFLFVSGVQAEGWAPSLAPRTHLPPLFMAVDKSEQQAYLIEHGDQAGGLKISRTLTCTTGMKDGDKKKEGDLKTPEGVYFMVEKINSGLDFTQYGNTAFPLNYPNPVDRILGKSGYGIWIHGRGTAITPKITRGCVALLNPDVDGLDRYVTLHTTPVIIAQKLVWPNTPRTTATPEIVAGTWAWANALERADSAVFHLYDPELYAKSSGQAFDRFTQTLFDPHRPVWSDIRIEKLEVLDGPGYAVSAFVQRTLPEGTAGHRRLYWMKRGERWKIVGDEWIALKEKGGEYSATVDREIRATLRQAELSWSRDTHHILMRFYEQEARRDGAAGKNAIAERLRAELDARSGNPFSGEVKTAIRPHGVEAFVSMANSTSRKFVFLPGAFDTWRIVDEVVAD